MTAREYQECDFSFNIDDSDDESTLNFTPKCSYYDFDQFCNSISNAASTNKPQSHTLQR